MKNSYMSITFLFHGNNEVRIEKKLPLDLKKKYPVCISGKNAGPSEDPSSIDEFAELLESSNPGSIALDEYEEGELDREGLIEIVSNLEDLRDKFVFSRKVINQELQDYPNNEDEEWEDD
jgi:hypothetical protein